MHRYFYFDMCLQDLGFTFYFAFVRRRLRKTLSSAGTGSLENTKLREILGEIIQQHTQKWKNIGKTKQELHSVREVYKITQNEIKHGIVVSG